MGGQSAESGRGGGGLGTDCSEDEGGEWGSVGETGSVGGGVADEALRAEGGWAHIGSL